jgi:hypothetical protein
MGKKSRSQSGRMNIPKILKFFDADVDPDPRSENLFDPGSGMEKIRTRDKHPRSATLTESWPLIFIF